jgi:hypothetical protein
MKKMPFLLALLMVAAATGFAQNGHPKIEAYGNYQLFLADVDALDNETLHGFGGGVQWNPYPYLGAVAEVNGAFGSSNFATTAGTVKVNTHVYTFLFGPRGSWRKDKFTLFAHGLFGFGTFNVDQENCSVCVIDVSNSKFAAAVGGGLDVNLTPGLAIRAGQFDYVPIRTSLGLNNGGSSYFRNFRYQAGVVFKFKGTH